MCHLSLCTSRLSHRASSSPLSSPPLSVSRAADAAPPRRGPRAFRTGSSPLPSPPRSGFNHSRSCTRLPAASMTRAHERACWPEDAFEFVVTNCRYRAASPTRESVAAASTEEDPPTVLCHSPCSWLYVCLLNHAAATHARRPTHAAASVRMSSKPNRRAATPQLRQFIAQLTLDVHFSKYVHVRS